LDRYEENERNSSTEVVQETIKVLKETGISSLHVIKKYAAANYTVDSGKLSHVIAKYLERAVALVEMVQTKGKRATCSKLAATPARWRGVATGGPSFQKPLVAKTKVKLAIKMH
jgi:hypothetical protein